MQQNKSKTSSVLVQAGVLAAASIIVRIIGLLYRSPLTAIIGDEGNGYYGSAYNIYTIVLMISSYSVPSAISKLMSQKLALGEYKNAQQIFHSALFYGLLVGAAASALLFFGASILVPTVAVPVLQVFAPTVFLFGLLGALRGYFQAHGSMVQTSVSQILEQLANAAVSIGAAAFLMHLVADKDTTTRAQYGAMGSALGTGSGVLIALLFMCFCYYRHHQAIKERCEADTVSQKERFGAVFRETVLVITPFMLSGVILNLTTSLNQTIYYRIMIYLRGVGETAATTDYGIFSNKAVVISNIPISIATAMASAIIPSISAAYARGSLEETRHRAYNSVRITAMIAIPATVGLCLLSRPITWMLYPQMESLDEASGLLSVVAITVLFYSVATITNAVLQSIGKINMPLVSAGIALIVQTVVLCILLVTTNLGVYALAIVSVIYSVMIFACNEIFLSRYLKIRRDAARTYGRPFLCALVMGAAGVIVYELLFHLLGLVIGRAYFVNLIAGLLALLVCVVLYFFLLAKSGTMTRNDVRSVPKGEKICRLMERFHWFPARKAA